MTTLATDWIEAFADRGGRSRWIDAASRAVTAGLAPLPDRVLLVGYDDLEPDLHVLLQRLSERGVTVTHGEAVAAIPTVDRHSCPHPFAELRLTARLCSDAFATGVPWHAMVVAAPRLHPYLDHLTRAFASEGVPLHTAAETPLIRHPRAALYAHIARLLFDTAPRSPDSI